MVDYPIVAKNKTGGVFKRTLISFFNSLIRSIAAKSYLFTEPELMENIFMWVSSMTSASSRPFRHTGTVVALAIMSGLAEVGKGLVEGRANTLRQVEGEQKKQKKNQARIKDLQATAQKFADLEVQLKGIIAESFDSVFVHRYRDVDPKIRLDCVTHLGEWIKIYPDYFFDGSHLRYLGWVLSDMAAPTRHEVTKQLQSIYKDEARIPGLRMFTERFRPRMVEMAARDAETGVRVDALGLLEVLRSAGLLEPDDIDTISKLIYDTDPRIRKAVVPFFVASVTDICDAKIDELGGQEALEEALPGDDGDDYESPRLLWLKLKSLAEHMHSLDPEEAVLTTIERGAGGEKDFLIAAGTDSRVTLATQAIMPTMTDMEKWECIAGFLLFDHSQSAETTDDVVTQFNQQCQLTDKEEVILLDVLNTSVKNALIDMSGSTSENTTTAKKAAKKLNKAQQGEIQEEREAAAQKLAQLIPRLLKKFGPSVDAASAVLRLEHVLNLDVFQDLRQDSTTFSALLDDINKQFLTHENRQVLFEASDALRHAKSFEELGEIAEGKLQALWEDTTHALVGLCKGEDVDVRGSIDSSVLKKIESTILRIANLARISDCSDILATPRTSGSSKQQRRKQQSDQGVIPLSLLIDLIARGRLSNTSSSQSQSQRNRDLDLTEDAVVENAMQSVLFYFMWSVSSLHSKHSSTSTTNSNGVITRAEVEQLTALTKYLQDFTTNLDSILTSRHGIDSLRLTAVGTFLDVHNLFITLRNIIPSNPDNPNAEEAEDIEEPSSVSFTRLLSQLAVPIPRSRQKELSRVFAATERDFSKKGNHPLEAVVGGQDDLDEYYSDEPEDEEDDDDDDELDTSAPANGAEVDEDEVERRALARQARDTRKQHAALRAEERLCRLAGRIVIALRAGVLDAEQQMDDAMELDGNEKKQGPMYKRVTRNRNRLGHNYKEIMAVLDADSLTERPLSRNAKTKAVKARKGKKPAATGAKGKTSAASRRKGKKSKDVVSESEEEEEEEEVEEEQEEQEPEEEEVVEQNGTADEEMQDANGEDEVASVLGD